MLYGLLAAKEALSDAKWEPSSLQDRLSTGVCMGSGMSSCTEIADAWTTVVRQVYIDDATMLHIPMLSLYTVLMFALVAVWYCYHFEYNIGLWLNLTGSIYCRARYYLWSDKMETDVYA
jgi:hypothetical protein